MKNDELIITSGGYFNNGHLGFSGLPQIHEGIVSVFLSVSRDAYEQFLDRTNLTEESKKYIMSVVSEKEIPVFPQTPFEISDVVCVNYLTNGDVTASIVDVSSGDSVGVRLYDAEKDRLKTVFDVVFVKNALSLKCALLEASIGKEVPPLTLKNCYHFEDWTPIDADNGEMLVRLSPSLEDLEAMVQRTPLGEHNDVQAFDDIEVYAYIKPNNMVRAKLQPVQFVHGETFTYGDEAALPLTDEEQHEIAIAVDIELAKNNILHRLYDKNGDELQELLVEKIIRDPLNSLSIDESVWKEKFTEYCLNEALDLIPQQYVALLSSKNILNDAYNCFLENSYGDYEDDYGEIGTVLADTANTILLSANDDACHPIDAWTSDCVYYVIGQFTDDADFYKALAIEGNASRMTQMPRQSEQQDAVRQKWGDIREFEYDYKPSRGKVASDYVDKLAEEDLDRGEAEFGADGYRVFPEESDKNGAEAVKQKGRNYDEQRN